MSGIKAIDTEYNGYRFRSRLEARWAVFFDTLGVDYEYEPEGFQLPSGRRYLPDFRVKCWGTRGDILQDPFDLWVEVKGYMTQEDADKIREFCGVDKWDCSDCQTFDHPVLILSDVPTVENEYDLSDGVKMKAYDSMSGCDVYPFNYTTIDGDYFAAYPAVDHGRFYLWGDDSNYINGSDKDKARTILAYKKAKQARFEHGQTPTIKRRVIL